jgi:hypothetical protein
MPNDIFCLLRKIKNRLLNTIDRHDMYKMNNSAFVDMGYMILLRRKPDREGKQYYLERLTNGELNKDQFLDTLASSPEFTDRCSPGFGESIHHGRMQWVKSFPKADTIVDLGGSAKGDRRGALVIMGYPYTF